MAALLATVLLFPALATAQDMPGMRMDQAPARRSAPATTTTAPPTDHPVAGMNHGGMDHLSMSGDMGGMQMGHMKGALASYPMTRDASGTAWQPDSSPMEGIHGQVGGWSTMLHGYGTVVYDDQGGPRGDTKTFFESMLMGMAQRPLRGGTLTLRAMGSLDPLMGKRGYPLLLGNGETADGRTELIDRQHPHDLFMELAGVYSHPITAQLSAFVYLGWPGEPALGPATYMHRYSGIANPEAPIGHHWLDSTHITFGIATAGIVYNNVKLEASSFTGREPDEYRYDLDHPKFDSWSVRGTWNPSADWSLQVSHGFLVSPEQLAPEENERRTTASATYNRKLHLWGRNGDTQTTLAWGRKDTDGHPVTNAWLLDSAVSVGRHTVFGRFENTDKDELFDNEPSNPLYSRTFNVSKVSLGYSYTLPLPSRLAMDLGGLVSKYDLPAALDSTYGRDPISFMLFTRFKIGG